MAQVGDYIGNYRLAEVVNSGTFGQVFRAEHRWLARRQVAIKFLRLERLDKPNERDQFLHEAQILNQLKHPTILPILDFGLENEVPYIITEYASGNTLRAYLSKRTGRPVNLAEALHIIEPIGEALQHAHNNRIVHRDLKPENILFDAQKRPLLADFGIAIVLTTNGTYLGNIGGTAPYMAPEQFKGKVYPESDQYALGCLLYEMLTGQLPFQAPDVLAIGFLHVHEPPTPPRQLNPQIPTHVDAAILKAMAKERTERHASMTAFLDALRAHPSISQSTSLFEEFGIPTQPLTHPQTQQFDTDPSLTILKPYVSLPYPPQPASNAPPENPTQPTSPFIVTDPSITQLWPNHLVKRQQTNEIRSEETDRQSGTQWQRVDVDAPPRARQTQNITRKTGFSPQDQPATQQKPRTPKALTIPPSSGTTHPSITAAYPDPTAPPQRPQRLNGRRILLLGSLLLVIILLLGGSIFWAKNDGNTITSFGPLTATVTLIPLSKTVQNDYLIAGVTTPPDASQRQVAARVLTAQSDTENATGNATGSIPAKQAVGQLTFTNANPGPIDLIPTSIVGNDGVTVSFNQIITVPAASSATAIVPAYAVNAGILGNIRAFDVDKPCCTANVTVENATAFHGGQDAQPNSIIQQSDIDEAAKPLVTQLTTSTQATLQKQVQSNERVVDGSFQCDPTTTANHKAGDQAPSVTVSVSVVCSEEVFDFAGAQRMANSLLETNLPNGVDLTGYKLVEPIITSLVNVSVVSGTHQVNVNMQAAARWVYQFSTQEQQQIKQALIKLNKTNALRILKQYAGLSSANVSISSGSIMPAITSDIAVNIVVVPGLLSGAPATPSVPVGTPSGDSTPDSGTPNEGS